MLGMSIAAVVGCHPLPQVQPKPTPLALEDACSYPHRPKRQQNPDLAKSYLLHCLASDTLDAMSWAGDFITARTSFKVEPQYLRQLLERRLVKYENDDLFFSMMAHEFPHFPSKTMLSIARAKLGTTKNISVKIALLSELWKFCGADCVDDYVRAVHDPNPGIRTVALSQLPLVAQSGAEDLLKSMLAESNDAEFQFATAFALGRLSPPLYVSEATDRIFARVGLLAGAVVRTIYDLEREAQSVGASGDRELIEIMLRELALHGVGGLFDAQAEQSSPVSSESPARNHTVQGKTEAQRLSSLESMSNQATWHQNFFISRRDGVMGKEDASQALITRLETYPADEELWFLVAPSIAELTSLLLHELLINVLMTTANDDLKVVLLEQFWKTCRDAVCSALYEKFALEAAPPVAATAARYLGAFENDGGAAIAKVLACRQEPEIRFTAGMAQGRLEPFGDAQQKNDPYWRAGFLLGKTDHILSVLAKEQNLAKQNPSYDHLRQLVCSYLGPYQHKRWYHFQELLVLANRKEISPYPWPQEQTPHQKNECGGQHQTKAR